MKNITLSHYTVKNIEPEPWLKTWENLRNFAERIAPKLLPMDIQLKLRKVILEDITQENLMMGNMVTIMCKEAEVDEVPIENLLILELGFSPCEGCVTPDGAEFPCRMFRDFDGNECLALPEEFFMEATLRVAFKASHERGCGGHSCSSCASGCDDEERGIRRD